MEVQLASVFLPLLLLAWLPAGLADQISATIDVSVGSDLILQCVLQTGSSCTTEEVKWFNITQNNGEKQNKGGVETRTGSDQLIFAHVNKAYAETYTGRMENRRDRFRNRHSKSDKDRRVSQLEGSDITVACKFKIRPENLTVHVECCTPADLEVWDQTVIIVLGQNCTNLTNPCVHAAKGICECITRRNLTDTGNSMQGMVPSCGSVTPQTNVTTEACTGLSFLLCITFGLAVGTLIYMPIIGVLLWQCGGNRRGKLTSGLGAEGNQLSTAAPVTGTEDLTYANLQFEKKRTKPTTSDVVYTEIKPSQPKQSSEDVGAAAAEVDVSPEGEEK